MTHVLYIRLPATIPHVTNTKEVNFFRVSLSAQYTKAGEADLSNLIYIFISSLTVSLFFLFFLIIYSLAMRMSVSLFLMSPMFQLPNTAADNLVPS